MFYYTMPGSGINGMRDEIHMTGTGLLLLLSFFPEGRVGGYIEVASGGSNLIIVHLCCNIQYSLPVYSYRESHLIGGGG